MSLQELIKEIEKLPDDKRKQVEEYVQNINAWGYDSKSAWEFKWEGALSDLKDKYTSVQLQKLAWGDKLKEI
jgi:hypothetical protein